SLSLAVKVAGIPSIFRLIYLTQETGSDYYTTMLVNTDLIEFLELQDNLKLST
ncbi:12878_t:CDS:1, partial [Racocetra persica]